MEMSVIQSSAPPSHPAFTSLIPWADSLELAVVRNSKGAILEVNRAFARKFGRPAPDWTGGSLSGLVHPEDVLAWHAEEQRLSRPPHHISREHRWETAQGWRWIGWEETALRNELGEVLAVRAIGRDVTKHRLAEEHSRKLAQALEQAPVSVIIMTPAGTPQYVNSQFTEVTGFTLEDIFEQEIPLLRDGHASEADYRRCCAILATGRKWTGELRTRRRAGGDAWEFVQISPIRNQLEEIIYLLCLREDISERKELAEQLRQVQKMESLGTMAGGIAHDFNNIISIVRGFTELALARTQTDANVERYLRAVHDAAGRAAALVSQIMVFSRSSEVRYSRVHIDRLVEEFIGFFSETFPRNIVFKTEFEAGVDAIGADPDQIRQLFVNLCVNARDAMPDGGEIKISTGRESGAHLTALKADPDRDYFRISVCDTGIGMAPAVCKRIFEPFFTTKDDAKGTGLGLAVVYGIVTNHHGLLDVRSEEGVGTTFDIFLPLNPSAVESGAGGDVPVLADVPKGTAKILLVEDETAIQELLSIALRKLGYSVEIAVDGQDAAERLLSGQETFDAIILDLNMPRLGGIEVMRLLASRASHPPILVMSGHLSLEVKQELEILAPSGVIAKPFELANMSRQLRRVLDDAGQASADGDTAF